ncbi:hypothetical protein ABFS82_07G024800 [Erythranthe guttata]|uniref:HMA domain-containing protein n=1 Tax=Erythranthe guttata TaxID=4155 RepID=A0A022RVQ6_ERYGU|nr:hypothetical protein MIMGU_mgv1a021509mg [Erythranthe guttata]
MAGEKKHKAEKVVVVAEYKVSMHCNACERIVAKAISKMKGVETFTTDVTNHRVVITGKINPHKVEKKLKKKTGKKVELLVGEEEDDEERERKQERENGAEQAMDDSWPVHYYGDGEIHMVFNDENANACSIM